MIKVKGIKSTLRKIDVEFSRFEKDNKSKILNSLINRLIEATPIDTGNAKENWKLESNKIINETEYISYLNEGSSQQAPRFFIEKTVLAHEHVRPSGMIVKDI
jgi:hypothetical protein